MARNPIIHNKNGMHRYIDFVSQVPDFIKAEEDVVTLLQVLSDYLNNAYRNVTTVEKFSFKLIATDANYGKVFKNVVKLANLFNRSAERNAKVLYLSYPQGNALHPSRPLYVEYIKYGGTLDTLSPNIINTPSIVTGDKFYIEFTADGQEENSGVYVYESDDDSLVIDAYGTSQDPFNNTPNKPLTTEVTSYAPRMLQFNVSDVSSVRGRRASNDNTIIFYEIFFNATLTNIEDVTSVYTMETDIDSDDIDEKILIDYYGFVDPVPSTYDESFSIEFTNNCSNFEWQGNDQGKGLFYFRELTNTESPSLQSKISGKNR